MIPVTFFMLALIEPLRNILMLIFLEHFLPTTFLKPKRAGWPLRISLFMILVGSDRMILFDIDTYDIYNPFQSWCFVKYLLSFTSIDVDIFLYSNKHATLFTYIYTRQF